MSKLKNRPKCAKFKFFDSPYQKSSSIQFENKYLKNHKFNSALIYM